MKATKSDRKEFRKRAGDILNEFGITRPTLVSEIVTVLLAAMNHSNRVYHGVQHVLNMLYDARCIGWELEAWEMMAILFHDAVYQPGMPQGWSEDSSAKLFQALCHTPGEEMLSTEDRVVKTIIATAGFLTHVEDWQKAFLAPQVSTRVLDLDLLGFSYSWDKYKGNTAMLLEEGLRYNDWSVKRADLEIGRLQFLRELDKRPLLYYHGHGILAQQEGQARENIRREIKELAFKHYA